MSMIVLPAGQSLRDVAERLGVSVDELQKHSGVQDIEKPLAVAQKVEVPDGFLRSRATRQELKGAIVAETGQKGGMNMWLAMDIEQKRTRAAGGMKANQASEFEEEALGEARRAYLRYEADSNELAIELYGNATATVSIDVRAAAFAGQACAYAQRALLFGDTVERSRQHALSAAKAALLADPKLAQAHLGMALALHIDASDSDRKEALATLERAVELGAEDADCWAALANLRLRLDDLEAADEAAQQAVALAPQGTAALEAAARVAAARGDLDEALRLLHTAVEANPTAANTLFLRACLLRDAGRADEAKKALSAAAELATRDRHREALENWFANPA